MKNGTSALFAPKQILQVVALACVAMLCVGCGWLQIDDEREELDMQIVQLGQRTKLVLPSDQLFYGKTANFKPDAYDMLYGAAKYLSQRHVARLQVVAHLNNAGSDVLDQQLSKKQAEQVMKYLWSHMHQPVWVGAKGAGSSQPIVLGSDVANEHQRNRRVTIFFTDRSGV